MPKLKDQSKTYLNSLFLKKRTDGNNGVFSKTNISKGSILVFMQGDIINERNKYSIQIDEQQHLDISELIDDEICHSCNPNAYIDFSDLSIRAKKDISTNEEITLNYCASEEVSANPFYCKCGSNNCYGFVNGFKNLTNEQRLEIKDILSPFLLHKYY